MPRRPKSSTTDASLQRTLDAILARFGSEVAAAVRQQVADRVASLITGGGSTSQGAPRAAIRKPTATPKRKAGRGVRSFTDADLDRVLEAVKANPGKLPSQVHAKSGVGENPFDAAVRWLKARGKLKVVGKGRRTTYQVVA